MASLIISDTHFGLGSSTLHSPEKVDQLMREISHSRYSCDEVVLLGDIFDFWRSSPERAIRDALPFLKRLSRDGIKVRYVVGNHDHHLVVQRQESEFIERAARGDLRPAYIPTLRWRRTFAGLDVDMIYPAYRARCCRRTFLFTHGHHLDGVSAFTLQLAEKLRLISGEEVRPSDLEMMITYAYESIYRSAVIGEMVSLETSLWKASSFLMRLNPRVFSNQRAASIEGQYTAIEKFIRDRELGRVDCFIYGDTHRAGIFQRKGGPLVANTGCLMREEGATSRPVTPDTYLILDDGGLAIRELGRTKPLYLCELL